MLYGDVLAKNTLIQAKFALTTTTTTDSECMCMACERWVRDAARPRLGAVKVPAEPHHCCSPRVGGAPSPLYSADPTPQHQHSPRRHPGELVQCCASPSSVHHGYSALSRYQCSHTFMFYFLIRTLVYF